MQGSLCSSTTDDGLGADPTEAEPSLEDYEESLPLSGGFTDVSGLFCIVSEWSDGKASQK